MSNLCILFVHRLDFQQNVLLDKNTSKLLHHNAWICKDVLYNRGLPRKFYQNFQKINLLIKYKKCLIFAIFANICNLISFHIWMFVFFQNIVLRFCLSMCLEILFTSEYKLPVPLSLYKWTIWTRFQLRLHSAHLARAPFFRFQRTTNKKYI